MKQSRSCHSCQRHCYNLMNANCGHKICLQCAKLNRNTNKCSDCISQTHPRPRSSFLTPTKKLIDAQQSSTKVKDSEPKLLSQESYLPKRRQSFQRSQIKQVQKENDYTGIPAIKCKQHNEVLSMYSKSAKDLICSICVCSKTKLKGDVVPLRQAQQHLKKQNRLNKQEAKVILTKIEHAQRIMNKNTQIFQNTYKNGLKSLEKIFQEMKKQVQTIQHKLKQQFMSFFQSKFKECDQITQDLGYLCSILKEYRDNNRENLNFSQLIYMFTSFKLIRGTIRNLDFDYIPYLKNINLVEINKYHYKDSLKDFAKLKLNLPLKFAENKKSKSRSNKSVSKSKHEDSEEFYRGHTGKLIKEQRRQSLTKKHQMSLCSNVHGIELNQQQKNLYKMFLKTKFKL